MLQSPIQIAARGIGLRDWWRRKILRRAEKLSEFNDRITHCRVVVEKPHKHRHKGELFNVRIDVEVPRGLVIVDREPAPTLNEAIDRAFDAAERRVEDKLRVLRNAVKRHEHLPEAVVAELFADGGYGFLDTDDGRRIYFHRNAVLGEGFGRLTVGTRVRFAEEEGGKGPQASSLSVIKLAPRPERRRGRRRQELKRRAAPGVAV